MLHRTMFFGLLSTFVATGARLTSHRPELTVQEHIRIFSDLKCLSVVNNEVVDDLAKGVDLLKKLSARAKTLSGGQKRKLQMAMMFAGGSAVCCVDEVSTGLDPISRRRIWEILLAERSRRTIIMTTHFLDEVDYLADNIVIMYKGTLRAEGTSASLKHAFGDGYTIKLPYQTDVDMSVSGPVQKEQSRHQTVYRAATAALAAEVVEKLEKQNLLDYQLSGPTMEELFIKTTGDTIQPMEEKSKESSAEKLKGHHIVVDTDAVDYELVEGRPISVAKQWSILLSKRAKILKRRWIPYFVAIAFALVGAGVAPLLIDDFKVPLACPTKADLVVDKTYRSDFGTRYSPSYANPDGLDEPPRVYVFGPTSKFDSTRLELMADVYSTNHTRSEFLCDCSCDADSSDKILGDSASNPVGYPNAMQLENRLILVDTYEEFSQAVQSDWQNSTKNPRSGEQVESPATGILGGIWIGDNSSKPTILVDIVQPASVLSMLNFYNTMASGVGISASYYEFAATTIPNLIDTTPLTFIIYYGLIMAW
jgi:ATP-binding cassette subfamily A (ABC1) protein 3